METLTRGLNRTDPDMMEAVARLKKEGFKLAVLTNNWKTESSGRLIFEDLDHFDHVVESCLVGKRKPEADIYTYSLDKLGVKADEAVFLDDLGHNLKAADQLGIATIKVSDVPSALVKLQNMLGIDLGVTAGTSRIRKGMEIDQDSLKTYLTGKLKLPDGPMVLRQFQHGQSNPTYLIQLGNKKYVLRKKPPGKLLPGAHAVEREFRIMKVLGEHGVPVPKLLDLCEDSRYVHKHNSD